MGKYHTYRNLNLNRKDKGLRTSKDHKIYIDLWQRHQILSVEHQRCLLSVVKWAKSWVDFTPGLSISKSKPKAKINPNKEYLYNVRLVNAVEKLRKVEKKLKLLDEEISDNDKRVSEKLDKFRSHKPKGSK